VNHYFSLSLLPNTHFTLLCIPFLPSLS
jgi:hypothetical protein